MRQLLLIALSLIAAIASAAGGDRYSAVTPDRVLVFPRDHGSHPAFRTEWWYATGWLQTDAGEQLGFQITFFRARTQADEANPSAFTPQQLIIAHGAISDPRRGRLWKDQRIARAVLGLAGADETDTRVWLDRWQLARSAQGYSARIDAEEFGFDLALQPTQPVLLNGRAGFSQKGPQPRSASYYYSQPHLRVTGSVTREGQVASVTGTAWLDHEWSSEILDAEAIGWDWIGINLDDGGALMAFRLRDAAGRQHWAAGTLRSADGRTQTFEPEQIEFTPGRRWRSPRTGYVYPVEWRLQAGALAITLQPMMDDQEADSRMSTGAVYWEGAVTALVDGKPIGRGYLELTGYGERLRLP